MSELSRNHESENLKRLRELERSGRCVFHGSGKEIDTLEPRQAVSRGEKDGDPAVCASVDVDTAIFMALTGSAKQEILLGKGSCRSGYSRSNTGDRFYATDNISALLQSTIGYVHVLDKEGFVDYYEGHELRSENPVTPKEVISVSLRDFVYPIEIVDD
jgi:hypothetical protein